MNKRTKLDKCSVTLQYENDISSKTAAPGQAAPRQADRIPPVGHCPVLCAQNAGEGVLSGAVLWHFGSPSDWKINTPRQNRLRKPFN